MENKPAVQQAQLMPMIIDRVSKREIVRHFGSYTPAKVVGGNFPSMAKLRKSYGVERIEKTLAWLIMETAKTFNELIPPTIAEDTAADILAAYYYLTLEDCFVCFNQLKSTKLYGKFTPNTILQHFAQYDTKRQTLVDELSYNEHLAAKESRAPAGSVADVVKEKAAKQREFKKWGANKLISEPLKK